MDPEKKAITNEYESKQDALEKDLEDISSSNNELYPEKLTIRQQYAKLFHNLKKDRRFALWSLYVMSLVFGWGYDAGLSGVAIAYPQFRATYGNYYAEGHQYVIPALWQSLWNAASTIGQVFGAYLSGQFADWKGRKPLLFLAVFLSIASSFALVFAPNLPTLFVSKLFLGLSVGFSTAIPPLYVTENAPANLRSVLSSLTNIIIVLGFFLSSLTGYGSSYIAGQWSYRVAFLLTFLVPSLFLLLLPWLPESPVWYMKQGEESKARIAIIKLFGPDVDVDARMEVIRAELKDNQGEKQSENAGGWKEIFSKEHRTRTLTSVLALQVQNFSGGYFANTYQTYYFQLIGKTDSFALTSISSALQFLANLVAVCLSDILPRRKALIGGGCILCIWSLIIGGTSLAETTNTAANTALVAFMLTWSMLYTASVGCFGWAVAQETAAQSTRPKTISFTVVCQQLTGKFLVYFYLITYSATDFTSRLL
jgi:SP family general alpha glucoside:H+ symporter-like MFS transporter